MERITGSKVPDRFSGLAGCDKIGCLINPFKATSGGPWEFSQRNRCEFSVVRNEHNHLTNHREG